MGDRLSPRPPPAHRSPPLPCSPRPRLQSADKTWPAAGSPSLPAQEGSLAVSSGTV